MSHFVARLQAEPEDFEIFDQLFKPFLKKPEEVERIVLFDAVGYATYFLFFISTKGKRFLNPFTKDRKVNKLCTTISKL